MFDKLFGWGKKKPVETVEPAVVFGRYSDNNKPPAKVNRWTDADNFFKEKNYPESLDAFLTTCVTMWPEMWSMNEMGPRAVLN